jgi:anthranilate synthase component 1
MKVGQESFATDNHSEDIRRVLSGYRSFKRDDLPPFTGGLVGYFSYDYFS